MKKKVSDDVVIFFSFALRIQNKPINMYICTQACDCEYHLNTIFSYVRDIFIHTKWYFKLKRIK